MKTTKIIYWITTILITLMMTMSGIMQFVQPPQMLESFKMLGLPAHLMFLLGSLKLLGAIALVFPGYAKIREWAYAGFVFLFTGATFLHFAVGDYNPTTLILGAVLLTSYFTWTKIKQANLVKPV
jgi:uncharacterized membrane protein